TNESTDPFALKQDISKSGGVALVLFVSKERRNFVKKRILHHALKAIINFISILVGAKGKGIAYQSNVFQFIVHVAKEESIYLCYLSYFVIDLFSKAQKAKHRLFF
ncbi:hypothetical protein ACJX0J_040880, partial [Zea mays]